MRPFRLNCILSILCTVLTTCSGGAGKGTETPHPRLKKVSISLSNEDRFAPAMVMDVLLNGEPVFHGTVLPGKGGSYLFLDTQVPYTDALLEVFSATNEGVISAKRELHVKDRVWIVITRIRAANEPPELQISVAYERLDRR